MGSEWAGVALVIPYNNPQGDSYRAAALKHIERWWREATGLQATTYSANDHATGRWSKGASIILGVRANRSADFVLMADADVLPEYGALLTALRSVRRGGGWVMPHSRVRRLSEAGAKLVIEVGASPWLAEAEYINRAMPGGGLLLLPRELAVACPPDPRFVGWGNEDESWAMALNSTHGAVTRFPSDLAHLWHPRAERINPWLGSVESGRLRDRYRAARRDREATRRIIDEFRADYEL